MATMRVKDGVAAVVFAPDGTTTLLAAGMAFDDADPVVRTHPSFFQADAKAGAAPQRITAVAIEDASAAPGHLRNR